MGFAYTPELKWKNDTERLLKQLAARGESTMSQIAQPMQPRATSYTRQVVESLIREGRITKREKPGGIPGRPCWLYRAVG